MSTRNWSRTSALAAAVGLVALTGVAVFGAGESNAGRTDYTIAQKPLYMGQSVPPLMMMPLPPPSDASTSNFTRWMCWPVRL